jgi:phosphoenolpyruvate synthase/pyruvate phosphate dikinase
MNRPELVLPFRRVGLSDVARVGGKNASLGELIQRCLRRRGHAAGDETRDPVRRS